MFDFLKEYIGEILITIISASVAFITGKSRGQVELKQLQGDALHTMQSAYDAFTTDTKEKFDEMHDDIKIMQAERLVTLSENKELKKYVLQIESKLDDCINSLKR